MVSLDFVVVVVEGADVTLVIVVLLVVFLGLWSLEGWSLFEVSTWGRRQM